MCEMPTTTKIKLLIDTDAGVDDAQAILIALSSPVVDVIGITCVAGNANSCQIGRNVLRILHMANRMDIPVFIGCNEPLLGNTKPHPNYNGSDGLGDAPDPNAPSDQYLQSEHAVQAILRMSKEHEGNVSLVAIGPLTNVAMAIRMDPQFGSRLKHCFIMGGNYTGKGNTSVAAEFNFYCDPESAYVVLHQLATPITLLPWEVCDEHALPWDFYDHLRAVSNPVSSFLSKIEARTVASSKSKKWSGFVPADDILMAFAISDDVIKTSVDVYATVEVKGEITSGQMVVDWNSVMNKKPNIKLVTDVNDDVFKDFLWKSMNKTSLTDI